MEREKKSDKDCLSLQLSYFEGLCDRRGGALNWKRSFYIAQDLFSYLEATDTPHKPPFHLTQFWKKCLQRGFVEAAVRDGKPADRLTSACHTHSICNTELLLFFKCKSTKLYMRCMKIVVLLLQSLETRFQLSR